MHAATVAAVSRTSRKTPWWVWLLVAVGAGGVVVSLVGVLAGVWLFGQFLPTKTEDATCVQRLGVECSDLTPEVIAKNVQMELPPGTVVETSHYEKFQDWQLTAVFVVPANRVGEWKQSLGAYAVPTAVGCHDLEGRGTDRVCADGRDPSKSPYLSYTRVTQPDGSVVVAVKAIGM